MKKKIVVVIALMLLLATLLTGCAGFQRNPSERKILRLISGKNYRISYIFNNYRENHRFLHFPGSFFVGNGKIKKLVVSSEKMM